MKMPMGQAYPRVARVATVESGPDEMLPARAFAPGGVTQREFALDALILNRFTLPDDRRHLKD